MKKIKTLVFHHLKKDKGSYLSFGVIIMFTALMLNLALVLALQVDRAYDAKFETLHAADLNFCIPQLQNTDELAEDIKELNGVNKVEDREAVYSEAVVKDFRGADFSMNTVFYNIEDTGNINQLERKDNAEEKTEKENGDSAGQEIWLPLYVSGFGEFEPGDEIVYEIDGKKHKFSVVGVAEEMQYGNYGKGLMGAYLSESAYEKLAGEMEQNKVTEYSLILDDDADLKTVQNEISDLLSEQNITMLTVCDRVSTKDSRTMVCDLLILILVAFTFVILLVSAFLCKFRIRNTIEEEMVNMGVLKALGYTGNMIIGSMILPYVIVTILASLIGIFVSYGILPALSQVLALQSGFSFVLSFDVKALLGVEVILLILVAGFTYGAARRIRKVQPIQAIRGNSEGKQIRKNHFPLEKTSGNMQFLLMLKQMMNCKKQNVLLFLVAFVLTILVAFSSTFVYNVIIEPDNFMSTLSEEVSDVVVYPNEGSKKQLEEILERDTDVDQVLTYMAGAVKVDDTSVTAFVCEDFGRVTNDLCYLGENPKTEQEVALGSAFQDKYEVGDTIEIENGEITGRYEVTGFVQSVNYQGNICEFTVEGYEELQEKSVQPSLYIYLKEGKDAEAFVEKLEEKYSDMLLKTVNAQSVAEKSREMYAGLAAVLILVIFILTVLIALFILYIVIRSLIVQRKQELGIYKAMGYRNSQLMIQTAGSFLPVLGGAVLLSSVLALIYMPYINQFIFQTVGAMKNNMEVSFPFLMMFALVQIVVEFLISIGLTMPIRKISAYSLIKE